MKIFGVGKNYFPPDRSALAAADVPKEPIIFLKADSSYLHNHKPFFIPDFMGRIDYEGEIVVRINRLGKGIARKFAHRYYDAITMGIDFTAHDYLVRAQQGGLPWDICKGFDGASVVGTWVEKERFEDIDNIHFTLDINGKMVQTGCTSDMIFSVDEVISYVSQFYTLRTGDLLFTGTPVGTGPVSVDDHFEGFVEGEKLLEFRCK